MDGKLIPRQHFKQFIKSPETAGQNDSGITEFIHFFLSFMHIISDHQLANAMMLSLPFNKNVRYDANDIAPVLHYRINNYSHQARTTTTIDHLYSMPRHEFSQS